MNFNPKPGDKNPNAKLTWEKVRKIRAMERQGVERKKLADMFGVSLRSIAGIVIGRTWQEGQYVHGRFSKRWY